MKVIIIYIFDECFVDSRASSDTLIHGSCLSLTYDSVAQNKILITQFTITAKSRCQQINTQCS